MLNPNSPPRQETARLGEDTAARYLAARGMEILERNARFRQGEMDIVALDGSTVVFVEVKTRRTSTYGAPQDAVHHRKQARLRLVASAWLASRGWREAPCRFDVVAIRLEGPAAGAETHVLHLRDAF